MTRWVCKTVHYAEQCRDVTTEECRDVQEGQCETVEMEECQTVLRTDCSEISNRQMMISDDFSFIYKRSMQECNDVPKFQCIQIG